MTDAAPPATEGGTGPDAPPPAPPRPTGWRRLLTVRGAGLAALTLCAAVVALDLLFPPPIARGQIVSTVVTDHKGRPLRAFPVEDGRWRLAARVDDIDPAFIEALIAIEDKRFRHHLGVDPAAILRAATSAVRAGEIVSGASTLTMQTARLLEPRPRNIGSKIIEIIRAVQLERRLTKDEILDLYLTLAPYGGNLEGVRTASWAYFGREPDALAPDQIALLIALPQAPEARRPDRRAHAAAAARARVLGRMTEAGLLPPARAEDAADEDIPARRHPFPAEGWHASAFLTRSAEGTPPVIRSTLDRSLQRTAERLVLSAVADAPEGVQGAALIIDTATGAVRASVGSASRARDGGWIDLTNRHRSPGSTLKPLIYGMGFDDGALAPQTLIDDLPSRFAGYRPENFDRTFRGEVTVAKALQHSLNVPAVRVLDQLGSDRFLAALSFAGSEPYLPRADTPDVGLAIALGGLGLTLRDMGVLYAGLAEGGRMRPLRWREETPVPARTGGFPLLSGESAGEVLGILAGSPAPPGRIPARLAAGAPDIAFKTGTSYGFRDAWAAGVSGGTAIVVWIGRPDGAPRPGVTGRQAALPLLFDLFDAASRVLGHAGTRYEAPAERGLPAPQARFSPRGPAPEILFPPDGAELWADDPARGFTLTGRGSGALTWYADGRPVPADPGGAPLWTPGQPGFFRLEAVDDAGRSTAVRVRVRMPGTAMGG